MNLLQLLLFLNFISIFIIFFLNPKQYIEFIRWGTLVFSISFFFVSLLMWFNYNYSTQYFQYYFYLTELFQYGLDGIALSFVLLVTFIFPIVILVSWQIKKNVKFLMLILLLLEFLLLNVFSILDLFGFYLFFELILLPMIYLIAFWGSDERRIIAIYYFFLYTLGGSLCMILGLIILYYELGTTNINILFELNLPLEKQKLLWFLFFIPLAIKIPMIPGHLWLLEAHPEAPTIGSIILAGLLLKMGSFGFLRILLMIFSDATNYFRPFVLTLSLIGFIYASLILVRQYDIKRIIAYSSIAHMNYGLLGMFSQTVEGVTGGIILMLSHGFTSSALFLLAGLLYDRFHERIIYYYSGLATLMPIFATFFLLIIISNFGFPGTLNFIGETLIFWGLFEITSWLTLFSCIGLFLSVIYSILLFNRIFFGALSFKKNAHTQQFTYFSDVTYIEFCMLLPLILVIFIFGIYSQSLTDLLEISIQSIILRG